MLLLNYNENYGHSDNIFIYTYLLTYLLTYKKKRFRMCEKKYLATHHTDFTFIFLHTSFHDDIW